MTLICISFLGICGCFHYPSADPLAVDTFAGYPDNGPRYQAPAPKPIAKVRLNKANDFRTSVDGCDFELVAIGRNARGKFTYWDPQGNPVPPPQGGFGPEGADTILIVRRTEKKYESQYDAIVPLDASGNPLDSARTSADWFMGNRHVEMNPPSSKNTPAPQKPQMVAETQFKLPFAVVRKDGTATFRFEAVADLSYVVEQLDLAQGSPKSKYIANLMVAEASTATTAAIEVHYKSDPKMGSQPPLAFAAILRTKDGKDVRMTARSTRTMNSDVTEYFSGAAGRFICLLVEKRRPWPITIEGVPMAPKGLHAPVSVLPKRLSPAKPLAPKVGQPATPANAWRGITASGIAYSVSCVTDESHSWSPDGLPLYRESHGAAGGYIVGQPATVSLNLKLDGVLMDDLPLGAELLDEATGNKLPASLFSTGSGTAKGSTVTEASYGIEAAKAPKSPVRVRLYLPITKFEKLGTFDVASQKSNSAAISDVKIANEPTDSTMTFTLTHPIVVDKDAKFMLRVVADGSYVGYARRIGVKADRLRVHMSAPSTAFKSVIFEWARLDAAEIRNVTLRRLAVNPSAK